jgi:hypothetical protein
VSNSVIKMDSGREIFIDEISQHRTYWGLLEGLPHPEMNEKIIESCLERARIKLGFEVEPVLICPPETPIKANINPNDNFRKHYYERYPPVKIPDIAIISVWNCYEPARNPDKMASALKIVWFQDKFAFPIDENIIEQIKKINWVHYAKDYDI